MFGSLLEVSKNILQAVQLPPPPKKKRCNMHCVSVAASTVMYWGGCWIGVLDEPIVRFSTRQIPTIIQQDFSIPHE